MLRIFAFITLFAGAGMSLSCNNDDDEPLFRMIYEIDFDIPAGLNTFANHFFPKENLQTRIDQFSGGVPLTDISSIRTLRATVTNVFDNTDFSVIEEAIIDVYDPNDPGDLFEAAYTITVPQRRQSELEMVGSLTNLQEVMTQQRFNLEFQFRLRNISTINQTWRLRLELGAFE